MTRHYSNSEINCFDRCHLEHFESTMHSLTEFLVMRPGVVANLTEIHFVRIEVLQMAAVEAVDFRV